MEKAFIIVRVVDNLRWNETTKYNQCVMLDEELANKKCDELNTEARVHNAGNGHVKNSYRVEIVNVEK